jgi:hypothetical protein
MRLINCATLKFEEFIGKNIPPYAILSHTWETYEISYKEYNELGNPRLKPGPQAEKIVKTCDIASQEGFSYVCESVSGGIIYPNFLLLDDWTASYHSLTASIDTSQGLIHAVLIRAAVQSLLKLSTPCSHGTKKRSGV